MRAVPHGVESEHILDLHNRRGRAGDDGHLVEPRAGAGQGDLRVGGADDEDRRARQAQLVGQRGLHLAQNAARRNDGRQLAALHADRAAQPLGPFPLRNVVDRGLDGLRTLPDDLTGEAEAHPVADGGIDLRLFGNIGLLAHGAEELDAGIQRHWLQSRQLLDRRPVDLVQIRRTAVVAVLKAHERLSRFGDQDDALPLAGGGDGENFYIPGAGDCLLDQLLERELPFLRLKVDAVGKIGVGIVYGVACCNGEQLALGADYAGTAVARADIDDKMRFFSQILFHDQETE